MQFMPPRCHSGARWSALIVLALGASSGSGCKPNAASPDDAANAGGSSRDAKAQPATAQDAAGAAHDSAERAARQRAREWLTLIDRGEYSESWRAASAIFQAATGQAQWQRALEGGRAPFGELTTRQFRSAQYETSLQGAPAGQYVIVHYDTTFAEKPRTREIVTLTLAPDESWKVAGYFIEPPDKH
jgi:hypothetical protein